MPNCGSLAAGIIESRECPAAIKCCWVDPFGVFKGITVVWPVAGTVGWNILRSFTHTHTHTHTHMHAYTHTSMLPTKTGFTASGWYLNLAVELAVQLDVLGAVSLDLTQWAGLVTIRGISVNAMLDIFGCKDCLGSYEAFHWSEFAFDLLWSSNLFNIVAIDVGGIMIPPGALVAVENFNLWDIIKIKRVLVDVGPTIFKLEAEMEESIDWGFIQFGTPQQKPKFLLELSLTRQRVQMEGYLHLKISDALQFSVSASIELRLELTWHLVCDFTYELFGGLTTGAFHLATSVLPDDPNFGFELLVTFDNSLATHLLGPIRAVVKVFVDAVRFGITAARDTLNGLSTAADQASAALSVAREHVEADKREKQRDYNNKLASYQSVLNECNHWQGKLRSCGWLDLKCHSDNIENEFKSIGPCGKYGALRLVASAAHLIVGVVDSAISALLQTSISGFNLASSLVQSASNHLNTLLNAHLNMPGIEDASKSISELIDIRHLTFGVDFRDWTDSKVSFGTSCFWLWSFFFGFTSLFTPLFTRATFSLFEYYIAIFLF